MGRDGGRPPGEGPATTARPLPALNHPVFAQPPLSSRLSGHWAVFCVSTRPRGSAEIGTELWWFPGQQRCLRLRGHRVLGRLPGPWRWPPSARLGWVRVTEGQGGCAVPQQAPPLRPDTPPTRQPRPPGHSSPLPTGPAPGPAPPPRQGPYKAAPPPGPQRTFPNRPSPGTRPTLGHAPPPRHAPHKAAPPPRATAPCAGRPTPRAGAEAPKGRPSYAPCPLITCACVRGHTRARLGVCVDPGPNLALSPARQQSSSSSWALAPTSAFEGRKIIVDPGSGQMWPRVLP